LLCLSSSYLVAPAGCALTSGKDKKCKQSSKIALKEAIDTLENLSEDQWHSSEQDGYRWQGSESH
jgi:hypothetical protein